MDLTSSIVSAISCTLQYETEVHTHTDIFIFSKLLTALASSLQRDKTPCQTSALKMTRNHLMVRLQSWSPYVLQLLLGPL